MAKCWLATWVQRAGPVGLPPVDSFHPAVCAYCGEPRDLLIKMLEEYRDWAGISKDDAPLRLEIESWLTLPAIEQERLVRKAQLDEPVEDRRSPW